MNSKFTPLIQHPYDAPSLHYARAISRRRVVATQQKVCRASLPWLGGIILLCFVGCGGSGNSLEPVSGTITLKGEPLANASVVFSPAAGQPGPSSVATTDEKGYYQLTTLDLGKTGAVLGSHRVTITTAKSSDPNDERAPISKELVPLKYRDGSFQMEVSAEGTAEANIEVAKK